MKLQTPSHRDASPYFQRATEKMMMGLPTQMAPERNQVMILGGGVAGLTTALELLRRGWSVTVIERGKEVGGLARTILYEDFRFDIGGHRFHSDNPELIQWLKDLLGDELLYVPRQSRIYLQEKFVDYPLQFPNSLKIFSPLQLGQVLASYLWASWQHQRQPVPDISFEDWVSRRFGHALYEIYFKPYTEKVWGIPCHELSADWATQRISLPNLTETIKRSIHVGKSPPKTIISNFWYPRKGFGTIPNRLAEEITKLGGQILTEAEVRYLEPQANGFQVGYYQNGQMTYHHAPHVISSIPLSVLLRALPDELGSQEVLNSYQLQYRDLICIFLIINQPQVSPDSWTYFPQKELIFGRTHEPRNWSKEMVRDGMTSLVTELFTSRHDAIWNQPNEALIEQTVRQLESTGFLPKNSVVDAQLIRVKNAYPVYDIGYADKLKHVKEYLSQWPTLHLVGRTGSFRYLNSDGVIEDAFALVDWLTGQAEVYHDVSEQYYVP